MSQKLKTALIVGASRGLGLGLAKAYLAQGWRVIATRRGASDALEALAVSAGDRLVIETLDVTDAAGIAALRQRLEGTSLDLLFASAGMATDRAMPVGEVSTADFTTIMLTNALAPMRIIERFAALVPADGTIAAMSSVLGSVSANTAGGYEIYRASKAALNTLLRSFAARNKARAIVAVHPGWVRTDMGGANADVSVDDSVAGMVAMLASRAGQPGCVFLDYQGKAIGW